jgi:hypothetical protein
MAKDDEDRILIFKVVKGNETLTIGCVYDKFLSPGLIPWMMKVLQRQAE